ncbi:MAG: metal ABC transporter ATP-binding protein [Verrucomicrobiales bacterium]
MNERGKSSSSSENETHASCHHCHPERKGKLDPVIELNDVHVAFGNQPVLRGVSLAIPKGEIVALIGPNGSGKTTLLRTIIGLQKIDRGEIKLFGESNLRRPMQKVGYVPQKLMLDRSFILSVREFLSLRLRETQNWFWQSHRATDKVLCSTLAEIGVEPLLNRPIAQLSGGQLQRVLIAFSLLHKPELLLLDEPTAGVDTPGEQSFYELINQVQQRHGLTVVLVSHDLSMVYRHTSWVYALNGVICCEGTPEHVMNAESLREAYGLHVSPYQHHHHVH